jgi:hypothetical protein
MVGWWINPWTVIGHLLDTITGHISNGSDFIPRSVVYYRIEFIHVVVGYDTENIFPFRIQRWIQPITTCRPNIILIINDDDEFIETDAAYRIVARSSTINQ